MNINKVNFEKYNIIDKKIIFKLGVIYLDLT